MADSPLKQDLTAAMKDAMRSRDKARLGTLRMALAEINRVEVDERGELDDSRVLGLLEKMIKQRRESARQYEDGGRPELAEQEKREITVLESFMPAALSADEIQEIVREAIRETGAGSMQEMGRVMAAVRPRVAGRADMAEISRLVKQELAGG